MMKIDFLAPQRSASEIHKATVLVTRMNELVATLTEAGQKPENKFTILGVKERAMLRAKGFPAVLVNNMAFFTEQVRVPQGDGFIEKDLLMVGFTSDAFDPELYASDAIRRSLVQSHKGRCAYCETLIDQTAYGDVEHFRPKAAYTTPWSPALFRPAYYALAYTPENLLYSCQLCNEAYKKNNFEVLGPRFPEVTVEQEIPVLINPYLEDPRHHVRFNPVNGQAYPFDLVSAFYSAWKGWGPVQIGNEIWKNPGLIPGQTNYQNLSITQPDVSQAFDAWLKTVQNPLLRRGSGTITVLGLNRKALVRSRVSHLRQLRGLTWAAGSTGSDQVAAQQLLTALGTGDPGNAAIAPQYLSLSMDAVQTWSAQTGNIDWVGTYNNILSHFTPEEVNVTPPPSNDALMYLVLESEVKLAGLRRIVYISDADRIYGHPEGNKGVFLAIDWNEDPDHASVQIRRDGVVREQMGLAEFVARLNAKPRAAYSIFRSNEIWAVGNFEPFFKPQ
jgi:uncharacterized protein (TIGR02646 family)